MRVSLRSRSLPDRSSLPSSVNDTTLFSPAFLCDWLFKHYAAAGFCSCFLYLLFCCFYCVCAKTFKSLTTRACFYSRDCHRSVFQLSSLPRSNEIRRALCDALRFVIHGLACGHLFEHRQMALLFRVNSTACKSFCFCGCT